MSSGADELFEQIPEPLRLGRPLALPEGLGEAEVFDRLRAMAERNADCESQVCFIGAGMYDHYVPALVDAITGRSEFLTPYTPYQPEISQGGLQVMFEFQTAISELTGAAGRKRRALRGPFLGRICRLSGDGRHRAQGLGDLAWRPPAQPRDAADLLGGFRGRGFRGRSG